MFERRTQKGLIDACLKNHRGCQPRDATDFLPSRLIDVRAFPNVGLISSQEIIKEGKSDHRYVTLSYCWGTNMPESGKATARTVQALSKNRGIDLANLPATPRDAVKLTSSLGIPFLWVDSLCILQDDKEDWVRESGQMSQVYSNSFLTIAAGASNHCDGGFLDVSYDKKELPVPVQGGFGLDYDMVTPTKQPNIWAVPFLRNPLFSRGWALQERELSQRILHFTNTHVVWECREEVGAYIRPRHSLSIPKIEYIEPDHWSVVWTFRCLDMPSTKKGFSRRRSSRAWPDESRMLRYRTWQDAVENYTRRRLTFASDKLPAISGLAAEVAKFVGSDYLAGLWRDNLLRDLLWQRSDEFGTMHEEHERGTYYAPTWSWASISSAVTFRNDSDTDEAEIVDAGVTQNEAGDKFEGGFVRLRAKLIDVPVKAGKFIHDHDVRHDPNRHYIVCILRSCEARPESLGGREGQQLVGAAGRAGGGFGLILEPVRGTTAQFRRTGMVETVNAEMFEGIEPQDFVII